ncbi:hypothetical protein [Glycomyces paridis]|uniref:Uncharacterized protein n=1 Tax=Glycomyces paridis TaxID=2126555 RepID=A0A4S8PCG0_9ACTN|nr:hypothetical protein [Glycomyces paridis]THV28000.1 hypothetical protein E9998_13525 [Glycomyces paridis]
MPVDAADSLAENGLEGFNVDAASRGEEPPASPGTAAAEEAVAVDFTGVMPPGKTADYAILSWVNIATGVIGEEFLPESSGTVAMEPGEYHLLVLMQDLDEFHSITGMVDLSVGTEGAQAVFDGTRARTVAFTVDRPVEPAASTFLMFSFEPGTKDGIGSGLIAQEPWSYSALPTRGGLDGREVGLEMQQELVSPAGTAEPYSYSLIGEHRNGIPNRPGFRICDAELARVEADYHGLGVETTTMVRHDIAVRDGSAGLNLRAGTVDVPSERTEFYTAAPGLTWIHLGTLGEGESTNDMVVRRSGEMSPGETTTAAWQRAPLSVGLEAGTPAFTPGFYLYGEYGFAQFAPLMFSSGADGEAIDSNGLDGWSRLARDGQVVAESETGSGLDLDATLIEDGWYTFTAKAGRAVPWTPLGTLSVAEWTFPMAPSGTNMALPVSVVDFAATGIVDGYATAGTTQQIDLAYTPQAGTEPQACTAMTLEVSFDDGITWQQVPIDRVGDRATAELALPQVPGFVSVRFSAADASGAIVEHQTLRSYGIA